MKPGDEIRVTEKLSRFFGYKGVVIRSDPTFNTVTVALIGWPKNVNMNKDELEVVL